MIPIRPFAFVSAIAPALMEDSKVSYSNTSAAYIGIANNIGYALGKFFNGFLVDSVGEMKMMIIFSTISVICTLSFSLFYQFWILLFISMIGSFVQSGLWPSVSKLIYEIFEEQQYGQVFTVLGVFSRIGLFLGKIIIGSLLMVYSWQWTLRLTSISGIFSIIWFSIFTYHIIRYKEKRSTYINLKVDNSDKNIQITELNQENNSINNKETLHKRLISVKNDQDSIDNIDNQASKESSFDKFIRIVKNRRFLLIVGANGTLTTSLAILSYGELFMYDLLSPNYKTISTGYYSLMASGLPLGLVIGLLITNYTLKNKNIFWLSKFVNYVIFISIIIVLLISIEIWYIELHYCLNKYLCLISIGVLYFLFGFIVSYPYYISISVFSLNYGAKDSGLVSALMEFFGFAISAPVSFSIGYLSDLGWRYVMVIFILSQFMCWIFFIQFNKYNDIYYRSKSKNKELEPMLDCDSESMSEL